jgi:hypothetical protein
VTYGDKGRSEAVSSCGERGSRQNLTYRYSEASVRLDRFLLGLDHVREHVIIVGIVLLLLDDLDLWLDRLRHSRGCLHDRLDLLSADVIRTSVS